jgi:hypothetical protein
LNRQKDVLGGATMKCLSAFTERLEKLFDLYTKMIASSGSARRGAAQGKKAGASA